MTMDTQTIAAHVEEILNVLQRKINDAYERIENRETRISQGRRVSYDDEETAHDQGMTCAYEDATVLLGQLRDAMREGKRKKAQVSNFGRRYGSTTSGNYVDWPPEVEQKEYAPPTDRRWPSPVRWPELGKNPLHDADDYDDEDPALGLVGLDASVARLEEVMDPQQGVPDQQAVVWRLDVLRVIRAYHRYVRMEHQMRVALDHARQQLIGKGGERNLKAALSVLKTALRYNVHSDDLTPLQDDALHNFYTVYHPCNRVREEEEI